MAAQPGFHALRESRRCSKLHGRFASSQIIRRQFTVALISGFTAQRTREQAGRGLGLAFLAYKLEISRFFLIAQRSGWLPMVAESGKSNFQHPTHRPWR